MATHWHREEPREVRPFFRVIAAEEALEACTIRLFEGAEVQTETSFDLDEIDFKKLSPAVQLAVPDTELWLPEGLAANDLELILVARHAFLKRSEIIHRLSLAQELPSEWNVGPDILDRMGGGRNLELTLALCLGTDRSPSPGSPFVAGHWLARKSFALRSHAVSSLFDLRTRNDEDWIAKGYPPKTFYAVEYIGGIDTELDEDSSVATVWIHIDAHNRMVSSSIGESIQPILAVEIMTSILLESFKDWKDAEAVEVGSPLATLLKQLGKEKPMSLSGLKALVSNPPLLKASLQDRLSVVASLK